MVILFKRAEKGLYFSDREIDDQNADSSTMAILRHSNEDSDFEMTIRASVVHRPQSKNIITRIYYWLLFQFESEFSYFLLTLMFTLFPLSMLAYAFISGNMKTLPLVNNSHCHMAFGSEDGHTYVGILLDVILRSFD